MGHRCNRPRNKKMLTEKSGTGSVRFYNRFSVFKIISLPIRTRQHGAKNLDFLLQLSGLNLYYLRDPRKEID